MSTQLCIDHTFIQARHHARRITCRVHVWVGRHWIEGVVVLAPLANETPDTSFVKGLMRSTLRAVQQRSRHFTKFIFCGRRLSLISTVYAIKAANTNSNYGNQSRRPMTFIWSIVNDLLTLLITITLNIVSRYGRNIFGKETRQRRYMHENK